MVKNDYPLHLSLLNNICGGWTFEHRFHPTRQWRFDFVNLNLSIAIEIEGGIFSKKRLGHSTGAGIKKDMEKYNAAAILGWKVLRYMPEQTAEMMRDIEQVVDERENAV